MREPIKYTFAFVLVLVLQYVDLLLHYTNIPHGGTTILILLVAGIMVVVSAFAFMELARASPATRFVGLLALMFVGLLCLGIAGDVGFR
jgi:heme/copper-type cytochrome/quinol oxidase subunit 4